MTGVLSLSVRRPFTLRLYASAMLSGSSPDRPLPTCQTHKFMHGWQGCTGKCCTGGLRIGLYDPLKRAFMGSKAEKTDMPGLHVKIAAGLTSGALAILVASPTDLVKVLDMARMDTTSELCRSDFVPRG